jgi:hypothetical protein
MSVLLARCLAKNLQRGLNILGDSIGSFDLPGHKVDVNKLLEYIEGLEETSAKLYDIVKELS